MSAPEGEVRIWHIECGGESHDASSLSMDELERASRFRFAADRHRFVRRRRALRALIGEALGIAPEAVRFEVSEWGKPEISPASGGLRFSLSHAHDGALVALARGVEVGADLERVRPWREVEALLPMVCSEVEQRVFTSARAPADLFARMWVWKEAVLKAAGVGFSRDPRTLEALDLTRPGALLQTWTDGGSAWHVQNVSAPEGYRAAVATAEAVSIVSCEWPGEERSDAAPS